MWKCWHSVGIHGLETVNLSFLQYSLFHPLKQIVNCQLKLVVRSDGNLQTIYVLFCSAVQQLENCNSMSSYILQSYNVCLRTYLANIGTRQLHPYNINICILYCTITNPLRSATSIPFEDTKPIWLGLGHKNPLKSCIIQSLSWPKY